MTLLATHKYKRWCFRINSTNSKTPRICLNGIITHCLDSQIELENASIIWMEIHTHKNSDPHRIKITHDSWRNRWFTDLNMEFFNSADKYFDTLGKEELYLKFYYEN